MMWQIYLRGGVVYVPTVAQTEAGFHVDIEPVEVASVTDTEALRHALKATMDRGNPIIPTPTRAAFPAPVVLKYANVKSWSAFENGTLPWKVVEKSGSYQIKPGRKRPDKGWEDDLTKSEVLPAGTTLNDVAQRLIVLIQNSGDVASQNAG